MKAAVIKKTGGPEVIQWIEVPMPDPTPYEILVKVGAVAVNPVDTYIRSGKYKMDPPLNFPFVVGSDMVGRVEKIGKQVTQFKVGDRVWTNSLGLEGRSGSFAEFVVVEESRLYKAPDAVDDKGLAALLQAGATACLGLVKAALLKAGETIFVNGAGGNVGSAVVQVAKARGAQVVATTSGADKISWCKEIGADSVLDYKEKDFDHVLKKSFSAGVDVFWDTSRNPNFEMSVPLLARKGRIILASGADAHSSFPVGPFYRKECSMKGISLLLATVQELQQCAELMNFCIEKGKLKGKIAHVMPLSEAGKAHEMVESQPNLWGKIVLVPGVTI